MGTRNDDISLILAKAKKQGFLPDVNNEEVAILQTEAKNLIGTDLNLSNRILNKRNLVGKLPGISATLPTVTVGGAGVASTIASAQVINTVNAGVINSIFTVHGTIPTLGPAYPDDTSIGSNNNNANLAGSTNFLPFVVEFFTDAPVFELYIKDTSTIRVLADGEYAYGTLTAHGWKGTSAGSAHHIKFDYGSRKNRLISVEFSGNGRMYATKIGPIDSLWSAPKSPLTLVVFGDSFTEPTIDDNAAFPDKTGHMGFAYKLGQLLGIKNTILSGNGGAGYVTPGPNSRPIFPDRAKNDIGKFKPDIVVMHTGINDNGAISGGTVSQEAYQAAIESVMINAWEAYPQTKFYLSYNGNTGTVLDASKTKMVNAMKGAAEKYVGSATYLPSMEPDKIYRGTGKLTGQTGAGNTDIFVGPDGTHPTIAGHEYLAYQLYRAIAETLS